MQFMIFIFAVHILLIIAVFDVYFQSTVLVNVSTNENNVGSFAERLVLFVGDGLRSDIFFGEGGTVDHSPFLRSLIEKGAPWGVSHTRVPTESRPGHVAIVAGLYEDPSAVFKGWKENPVNFDSVFNQSRATFSWGSPDIVPMFRNENSNPDIHCYTYSFEEQDFSGKNGSVFFLNDWVLNDFKYKVSLADMDLELRSLWKRPRVVFFFHLLGIDAAGHVRNPKSVYYEEAIQNTDHVVAHITNLIDNFFGDNRTAFIFTSDHGMTDWGSHGAGSNSETETPLVAWGSGVKPSNCEDIQYPIAHTSSTCNKRVNQADLAVLMSILLGNSIPVNSEGVLPVDYLNATEEMTAKALYLNGLQLLNKFNSKQDMVKTNLASFLFKPFKDLTEEEQRHLRYMTSHLMGNKRFSDAVVIANLVITRSLNGLRYYDRYFQEVKLFFLTTVFVGLIFLTLGQIMPFFLPMLSESRSQFFDIRPFRLNHLGFWVIGLPIAFLILTKSSIFPVTFTVYVLLPLPVWYYAVINSYWMRNFSRVTCGGILRFMYYGIATSLIFWGFFYRWILCLLMLIMMIWLVCGTRVEGKLRLVMWIVSSSVIALYTSLPTMTMSQVSVITSGTLWFLAAVVFMIISSQSNSRPKHNCWLLAKLFFMVLSLANIIYINERFSSGIGIHFVNQAISYICLVFFMISIFFCSSNNKVIPTFFQTALSLSMVFLLFCSGIESFFPIALAVNLTLWIIIETNTSDIRHEEMFGNPYVRQLLLEDDLRRSFFYLCYIVLSFFGIGNIDSLNSFTIAWVRGFVVTFSPFLITSLILIKTIIPFIMVGCAFRIIVIKTHTHVRRMFLVVLVFCNTLALKFLYQVTNEGSWLEIGKSISHFIIVEVIVLVLIVLYGLTSHIIRPPLDRNPWWSRFLKLHKL